ncbi:MAG: rRNA maturation RNase YbeY [Dehalococcoidia bacterium]
MDHEISLSIEAAFSVDEALLLRTAQLVLEAEVGGEAELSIVITDDATVQRLNRAFRGYDEPTDVLSFGLSDRSKPAVDGEEIVIFPAVPGDLLHLGEVVISYPTADRQAVEHNRPLEEELRHLLIHGILHLLGHDHAESEETAVMRRREVALLAASTRASEG